MSRIKQVRSITEFGKMTLACEFFDKGLGMCRLA